MKKVIGFLKMGPVLATVTMLTGCATPALWAKKDYQPSQHPRLALGLAQDGKDVLVCYDEQCGKTPDTQRRAYWLFAYRAKNDEHRKPVFADPALSDRLEPIVVLELTNTNAPPKGYVARAEANCPEFRLWRDGEEVGYFKLPAYKGAPPAKFWRVGLTAPAVAADAALVGAAIVVVGASGGPY
jgi:hypothetical protein